MTVEAPLSLNMQYFTDPLTGRAITNGSVYVGTIDLDPSILANRITINIIQEDGTRVPILPAVQPLTLVAGIIQYNGSPVSIVVNGSYSLKILDRLGAQIYYVPRANEWAERDFGYIEVDKAAAALITPVQGSTMFVESSDGGLFKAVTGAAPGTYSDNGGSYCGTQFIPTGGDGSAAWVRVDGGYNVGLPFDPIWYGAAFDGTTGDSASIQAALDSVNSDNRSVSLASGTAFLDADLTLPDKIKFVGAGREKTILKPDTGVTCLIVTGNDYEIGGFSIRNGTDQNDRIVANGIELVPASGTSIARKYHKYFDILIEYLDGFAFQFGADATGKKDFSLIESRFEFVHIRHCSSTTVASVSFYQELTNDSFNNITFNQFSIYAPHGVAFRMESLASTSPYAGCRDIRFTENCIIHGRAGSEGGPLNYNLMEFVNFSNVFGQGLRINTVASGYYGLHLDSDVTFPSGNTLSSRRFVSGSSSYEDDIYVGDAIECLFQGASFRDTTLTLSADADKTVIGYNATERGSATGLIVTDGGTNTVDLFKLNTNREAKVNLDGTNSYAVGISTTANVSTGLYRITFSAAMPDTDYVPIAISNVSDKFVSITNQQTTGFDVYMRNDAGSLADGPFFVKVIQPNVY